MTTIDDERRDFEAWIKTRPGHPFAGDFANLMWAAWLARAKAENNVSEPCRLCFGRGTHTSADYGGRHIRCSICNGSGKITTAKAEKVEVKTNPKLIGWRIADYTAETNDPEKAKNWSSNVAILPIFEGDPNTKLTALIAASEK
jgi:hypothetical protein